jgi:beta-xylosidase
MVWTVSWNEKGIGYANSPDLLNWSRQQYLPVMEHEPATRNCWAPEVFFDEESETYLILWASTVRGKFTETDSLSEDAYNHRMYHTTTKDFKSFTETGLFYDDGFCVIDATINKVDDQYVMFVKDETLLPEAKKNIRIATSAQLLGPYSRASTPITGNWVEGPSVLQKGDQHLIYFDRYRDKKMGAMASTNLLEWTDISDQISFPEGTRHGSVFKVNENILKGILTSKK